MVEIASEMVLRLADDASVQHVGDGAVVLLARSGQLYTCNGTTEAFLDKVDGARSLDQIVGLLSQEFDVDKDHARPGHCGIGDRPGGGRYSGRPGRLNG